MVASQSYPFHYQHYYYIKPSRSFITAVNLKKFTRSLLLWFIFLATFLLLILFYSPNPFSADSPLLITYDRSHRTRPSPFLQKNPSDQIVSPRNTCDLSVGKWVRDVTGPYYTNSTCNSMPDSKNCGKYGKDMDYLNWRWKPDGCELPRFDSGLFLRLVEGKKMAFVGDSVARNQFDSLVCLLSQEEIPTDIYNKDPEDRFRTFFFPSHNFTLMVLWTKFLVQSKEKTTSEGVYDLQINMVDQNWSDHLPEIDIVVVSTGHWFFRKNYLYQQEEMIGCIFCSDMNVTSITISSAIQKVFNNVIRYINDHGRREQITLLRTFSPAHFSGGPWNGGGYCNMTRPTSKEEVDLSGTYWDISRGQMTEIAKARKKKKRFVSLDVTMAMLMRGDSHPGSHWNNQWNKGYNDCIHWCLPGPIDHWNQLLLDSLTNL